jgi:hypothetical protein
MPAQTDRTGRTELHDLAYHPLLLGLKQCPRTSRLRPHVLQSLREPVHPFTKHIQIRPVILREETDHDCMLVDGRERWTGGGELAFVLGVILGDLSGCAHELVPVGVCCAHSARGGRLA